MKNIIIYTTSYCPYCVAAKNLLQNKNVTFTERDVENNPDLRTWLIEVTGQRTVPQVFADDTPLGGFDDILALDQAGKLDGYLR